MDEARVAHVIGAGQAPVATHPRIIDEAGTARPPAPIAVTFTDEQRAADPILGYFAFDHLPLHLQAVSAIYARAAAETLAVCNRSPERTVALRKLLEAKDAAVRAALPARS